jgi:hypothetical protein
VCAGDALDQDFHRTAGFLASILPRRQHARVVEDQQVARVLVAIQIGELAILEAARRHVDHEQAACRTLRQRRLCDQFGWKVVVEVGFFHRVIVTVTPHAVGRIDTCRQSQPFCLASR